MKGDFDYGYDPIGNRTESNVDGASPAMTYTTNAVNQYTATSDPESFTYDEDGNLDTDGLFKYAWDAENRLTAVQTKRTGDPVDGDTLVEFKYDYMGRRVEKTYSSRSGTSWIVQPGYPQRFVYDEWNVVLVLNDSGDSTRKYTWGLDLSGTIHGAGGIGGLLACEEPQAVGDPKRYWFMYDANGNVGQVLDATDTGNISIAARYEYDPYGNPIPIPQPPGPGPYADLNPIRFSTKWFDFETGLGYWGYRYYSPRLGRWISRDPIGEKGGLSLYAFVLNRPACRVDPLGESCKVYFKCSLAKSTPRGKCDMDCDYSCTETKRENVGGGMVTCDELPSPVTYTLSTGGEGGILCHLTEGLCGARESCASTKQHSQLYLHIDDPSRDCSRAACRNGCDSAYDTADVACDKLKGPLKSACKAAAKAARTTCYEGCNAWCKQP